MRWTNPFARWERRRDLDSVRGLQVEGDPGVPPTPSNPLKLFWHIHFVWRTVTVLGAVEMPLGGFFLGFKNFRGETYRRVGPVSGVTRWFAVRIGREACTFFAVDRFGREIPLQVVARTTKDDQGRRFLNVWIY